MAIGPIARPSALKNAHTEEMRHRYFGAYMGIVRDRDDPQQRGRIRAQCPAILGPDNNERHWLDWCLPKGVGIAVPPLGADIWLTFELGYVQNGVYSWGFFNEGDVPGQATGKDDPTRLVQRALDGRGLGIDVNATLLADPASTTPPVYPYNKVLVTEGGSVFELDDSPGASRLRYRHPSGTQILIDPEGNVQIDSAGAIFQRCAGDYVVGLREGATFKVIYDDGPAIALGASGFHVLGTQASLLGRTVKASGGSL